VLNARRGLFRVQDPATLSMTRLRMDVALGMVQCGGSNDGRPPKCFLLTSKRLDVLPDRGHQDRVCEASCDPGSD
jgi:hypothetical protein